MAVPRTIVNRRRAPGYPSVSSTLDKFSDSPGESRSGLLLGALTFGSIYALGSLIFSVPAMSAVVGLAILVVICLRSALAAAGLLIVSMLFSPEMEVRAGIRLRAEDLIIPLLAITLAARACIPRYRVRFRTGPLDGRIGVLLIVNAMASVYGVVGGYVTPVSAVLWNAKTLELLMIYWLTFNYVRDPKTIRRLVALAFFVLLGITAYTLIQIPQTEIHTAHRLTAPFEGTPEPTTLGGYLTLLLAIVMAMAIYESDQRKRIAWMALCVLVMLPILFTLSRTTYAMCAVMICLLGFLTQSYRLLIGALVIMIFSPWIMPQQVIDRVLMTLDPSRLYGIDPSSAERIMVWKKFLYGLRHSPLIGFGIPQPILDNQYVRTMLESGLAGLTAWGAIFWTCITMGRRLHRRSQNPFEKALAAGYVVGTAALLVHALATITLYVVRIMEPFWFFTGLIASLDAMTAPSDSEAPRDESR